MFFRSHEYVERLYFFSTFELNAWEDTWIIAIEALQEGKMKENKVGKEKEKEKVI